MDKQDLKKYFDILELKTDASLQEIERTFKHLKVLYTTEAPFSASIMEEISENQKDNILNDLESAYQILKNHLQQDKMEKRQITKKFVVNKQIPEFEKYSGNALRITREVLGVDIEEIAFTSKISVKNLHYIEDERFDLLPPKAYIRAYVKKIAEYLCLDTHKVVTDYMQRYHKIYKTGIK